MVSQTKSRAAKPKPGRGAAEPAELRRVLNSLRQIVRSLRLSSRLAEQEVGL
jgi:hypothetical protein